MEKDNNADGKYFCVRMLSFVDDWLMTLSVNNQIIVSNYTRDTQVILKTIN